MSEAAVLATIEDKLRADYEMRDPDSMTPDERGHLAHWQQARATREHPPAA